MILIVKNYRIDNKKQMSSQIKISSSNWNYPFLSMRRNNTLSYSIDIYSLYASASTIQHSLKKCKYCKSYPFSLTKCKAQEKLNICQLCGSINEYHMKWDIIKPDKEQIQTNNAYIIRKNDTNCPTLYLTLLISYLQENWINHIIQALKSIQIVSYIKISILTVVNDRLAIVDLQQSPELIILSQDIDIKEILSEKACILNQMKLQQLRNILLILNQSTKLHYQFHHFQLLANILKCFREHSASRTDILLWIGKIPPKIIILQNSALHIISILLVDMKLGNTSLFLDLSKKFAQTYFIINFEAQTQLYYRLHEILNEDHLGCMISGVLVSRTSINYSGKISQIPKKFINNSNSYLQLLASSEDLHKIQLSVEIKNLKGQTKQLVMNCSELQIKKTIKWHEILIMMSRCLLHVINAYQLMKQNSQQKQTDMDFFYILKQLANYQGMYQNNTKLYKQIIEHMINYFKQFQKYPIKMFLPFNFMFKKQLLFIFYPLWQGGVLHHVDGIWVDEDGQVNIEWCNNFIGVTWARRIHKLPIFYRLCLDNQTYSFLDQ